MDFTEEIAKQGFGYLLFAGCLVVLYIKDRQLSAEKDKRAADLLQAYKDKLNADKEWIMLVADFKNSINTAIAIFNKMGEKGV